MSLAMQRPLTRCNKKCWHVSMTSPLIRFEGALPVMIYFRTESSCQICKQVSVLYLSLSSRSVGCPSSMGQQKVPQPSHSPLQYGCTSEENGPNLNVR